VGRERVPEILCPSSAVDPHFAAAGKMPSAVVVGTGMAGAAAARTLLDAGWEVLVLEAEAQIGGHSRSTQTSLGPIDMGVVYVHPPTYPVLSRLVERVGAEFVPLNLGLHSVNADTVLFSSDRGSEFEGREKLLKSLSDGSTHGSVAQAALAAGVPMRAQKHALKAILGAFALRSSHPAQHMKDAPDIMPFTGRSTWYRIGGGFLSFVQRLLRGADVRTKSACLEIAEYTQSKTGKTRFVVTHSGVGGGPRYANVDGVVIATDPGDIRLITRRSREHSQRLRTWDKPLDRFRAD